MFDPVSLIAFICLYIAFLFLIATWVEKRAKTGRNFANNPVIYSLSLAIFCTSWTFYGSVGMAAASGVLFLPFYLGPMLVILLWDRILVKLVKIKQYHRINSIADFIAARYNRSQPLAALVTIIAFIGIAPYIALQFKAILSSINIILDHSNEASSTIINYLGPIIVILMISFTIIFGVRRLDPTERHQGMVVSIAVESVIKLVAFLSIGIFVCYILFDGIDDVFMHWQNEHPFSKLTSSINPNDVPLDLWITYLILGASSILFLPRQFHIAVVENSNVDHIRTSKWLFPLYLFLINLFILPVALAGLTKGLSISEADLFVISLPVQFGSSFLTLLVFIGGFSAATSMIMISSMTLSTMFTNHILLPVLEMLPWLGFLRVQILKFRWFAVAAVILLGYWFEQSQGSSHTLVNLGIISFAAAVQFAPTILGGIFWRKGSVAGAFLGMGSGFFVWFYTLLMPTFAKSSWIAASLLENGPFGIELLKPEALFGLTGLATTSHGVLWSLFFNVGLYTLGSLVFPHSKSSQEIADTFVRLESQLSGITLPITEESEIDFQDKKKRLLASLQSYLGRNRAELMIIRALQNLSLEDRSQVTVIELTEFCRTVEKLLAGSIGTAAAYRALKSAEMLTQKESGDLSKLYGKILAELEVSPEELKQKIDYHKERENLISAHAADLEEKVAELQLQMKERHRIEKELRRSEERSRVLLDASPDAVVAYDTEGNVTYINKAFENIYGWSAEELLGKKIDFVPQDEIPQTLSIIERMKRGESIGLETQRLTKDGNLLTVFLKNAVFHDDNGKFIGNIVIHRNVTELLEIEQALKESEEKYKVLYYYSKDAILIIEPSTKILNANPAAIELFGCKTERDIIGKAPSELSPRFQENGANSEVMESRMINLALNKGSQFFEWKHKKLDGPEFYATVLLAKMDLKDGTVLHATVRDISDQINSEKELIQAQKMETVGILAGGLAHDFNNVLGGIMATLSVMSHKLKRWGKIDNEKLLDYISVMTQSSMRAADMIKQLLTLSRKQELNFAPVDLNLTIKHVLKIAKASCDKSVILRPHYQPQPAMVKADPSQIEQVLLNLCVNAEHSMTIMRRKSEVWGGTMTLTTDKVVPDEHFISRHREAKPITYWKLSVKDTGIGIEPDQLSHIFDPFYSTKEKDKGTGLGLSMVYNNIRLHDGIIDVTSEVGKGTTIDIYLPAIDEQAQTDGDFAADLSNLTGEGLVLIVDDEDVIRMATKDILEECGYDTLLAKNGLEGVEIFQKRHQEIRAVILDMAMPIMSGREAFLKMKEIDPNLKVLLISGLKQDERVQDVLKMGVDHFLQKPFTSVKLTESIQSLLHE